MGVILPVERPDQVSTIVCAVVFSLLATMAVGLRILARRIVHRRLDLSDYLIISACVVTVGYQGLNIGCIIVGGGGFHISELREKFDLATAPEAFIKMMLAQEVLWALSLTLTKISILVLYCKIFTVRKLVVIAQITATIILLWMLTVILGCFLICQPTAFYWDHTIAGGHCGDSITLWLTTGTLNILTDVVVLLLPMPYIAGLKLALYNKLALMATFGAGIFVVIISAIRLRSLLDVDMTDVTSTVLLPILWSALEPCLGITLACVPLLRPLLGGGPCGGTRHRSTGGTGTAVVAVAAAAATAKTRSRTRGGDKMSFRTIGQKSSRRFRGDALSLSSSVSSGSSTAQLAPETDREPESSRYDAMIRSQVPVPDRSPRSRSDDSLSNDQELEILGAKEAGR